MGGKTVCDLLIKELRLVLKLVENFLLQSGCLHEVRERLAQELLLLQEQRKIRLVRILKVVVGEVWLVEVLVRNSCVFKV